MSDEDWTAFQANRWGLPGEDGIVRTGDPKVDEWERELALETEKAAGAEWAQTVKKELGIDV